MLELVPLSLRDTSSLIDKAYVKLRYIEHDSVVNGSGVRDVLWVQGCKHYCIGCHNPETWPFTGQKHYFRDIIDKLSPFKSVTWSGGDPVYQSYGVHVINSELKKLGYNIWLYTGFTWEYLIKFEPLILVNIDVLVDGKFEISKKTMDLPFVGSSNQRIIDVKKSLKSSSISILTL